MKAVRHLFLNAGNIDHNVREAMFALLHRYYDDVTPDRFATDLAEKDHVFSFWSGGDLVGFSTVMCRRDHVSGADLIFSGDTVIREDFWGRKFLQSAFSQYLIMRKLLTPHRRLFWMLISKGYKTYLMMRRNFPRSFPNPHGEPPPRIKEVMDQYYSRRFGRAYQPAAGLISFETSMGTVRGDLALPPPGALEDPDIAHFVRCNPDYLRGVELACTAEIRLRDLAALVTKYVTRRSARHREQGEVNP